MIRFEKTGLSVRVVRHDQQQGRMTDIVIPSGHDNKIQE